MPFRAHQLAGRAVDTRAATRRLMRFLAVQGITGEEKAIGEEIVAALKEAGVDGVEVQQWYGFFAPAKTPRPVIEKLNKAINQVLADKETEKRIEDHGADVQTSTPEEFAAFTRREREKWGKVVRDAGVKVE